jgi:signal transduction histidine kinase
MNGTRVVAAGSVSLTGFALIAGVVASYLGTGVAAAQLALVGLGAVLGAVLVAAGGVLYRSDATDRHALRVAGWNVLGVVALGAVLVLARLAPGPQLTGYVVVNVLGVSSVAHVLIGYNDVRRIRAEDLARQREKLSVVNRLVRHNVRNQTQILTGYSGQLREEADDPITAGIAEKIGEAAGNLSTLHERLQEFQHALDEAAPTERVAVDEVVDDVVDAYRDRYPGGTFETDVPAGLTVDADEQLRTALDHLVENAVEHGNEGVFVRVTATDRRGLVTLAVEDRGPGIPEKERAVVVGEREQSQLEHASGLGLWVVRAVVEQYDGEMAIESTDRGTTVTLSFEAA